MPKTHCTTVTIPSMQCRKYAITILGTHHRRPCTQYTSRARPST